MEIDDKLLNKLEKLSSLKFQEEDRASIESDLSEILQFVENLNELNTDEIEATFTTLSGGTRLEDDIVNSQNEISNSILENAPKSSNNFFIVPKIIE